MAEIDTAPSRVPVNEKDTSFSDEKAGSKEGSVDIALGLEGDVYDDVRAIDMGEDGKERPIGLFLFLHYWA